MPEQTVRRYDRGQLKPPRVDESTGFLHVDATVTRAPAVFVYQRPDGSLRRELRLADDVFSERNLASIRAATVTVRHPPERVTIDTVKRYGKGHGDGNLRIIDDHAAVGLVLDDREAIGGVESGTLLEVSLGYDVVLDETPGTWKDPRTGEEFPFDAIQRQHLTNHIALVERGRAGPTVRVAMDSQDAVQIDDEADMPEPKKPETRLTVDGDRARVRVDGLELELPTIQAKAVSDALAERDRRVDALQAEIDLLKPEAAKVKDLQAKIDATTAERDTYRKQSEDAAKKTISDEEIQKRVDSRVALLADARRILAGRESDATKLDAALVELRKLGDGEIRRRVVSDALGAEMEKDRSDAYVEAAFSIAAKQAQQPDPKQDDDRPGEHVQQVGRAVLQAKDQDWIKEVNDAADKAMKTTDDLWRKPIVGGSTIEGPTKRMSA